MVAFDNMGGIVSAEFILSNEIKYYIAVSNKCVINLVEGAYWKTLDNKHEGITIKIAPSVSDGGTIYQLSGTIICKGAANLSLLHRSPFVLLKYKTVNGETKIAGTQEYPLRVTVASINPTRPSDFSGYEVNFSGKQLTEPLLLLE